MMMVNWWHKESKNINANYQIHWRSAKTWWATFLIICQRFMLTLSFFAGGLVLLFQTASFTRYFILGFFFDYNFNFYVSLFRSSISGRELFYVFYVLFFVVYINCLYKKYIWSNAVPPVLLMYSDTPGVVLEEEQPQFQSGIIN